MDGALHAAAAVAGEVGLRGVRPTVVSDGPTTVLHLAPEPLVARVVADAPAARESVAQALEVTARLHQAGVPVAAPAGVADPGPHERDGLLVTLWELVDHDPDRPLDGVRAGRALRAVHDVLQDVDATSLPHYTRPAETRAVVAGLALEPDHRRLLDEVLAAARARVDGLDLQLQAIHGDAHLGNVLRTTAGPVWTDFDRVCRGPRELDLACNEIRVLSHGRTQTDDDLLRGYGDHDAELVSLLVPVHLAPLAARTFELAGRRPEFTPLAVRRLRWAADGLGL